MMCKNHLTLTCFLVVYNKAVVIRIVQFSCAALIIMQRFTYFLKMLSSRD